MKNPLFYYFHYHLLDGGSPVDCFLSVSLKVVSIPLRGRFLLDKTGWYRSSGNPKTAMDRGLQEVLQKVHGIVEISHF